METLRILKSYRHWLWVLLACVSASRGFSQVKTSRYVFDLLDSNFIIKKRISSTIRCQKLPDASARMDALNSIIVMGSIIPMGYIKSNSQPIGDVWLGYIPPSDPGAIVFLSNTDPVYPLLTLHLDGMCGGCIHSYEIFGNIETPADQTTLKNNVKILQLQNDFGLGDSLLDSEKTRIAEKIIDFSDNNTSEIFPIYTLKMRTEFPSVEGIKYICYSSVVDGSVISAIEKTRTKIITIKVGDSEIDALGRSVESSPQNFNTLKKFIWQPGP